MGPKLHSLLLALCILGFAGGFAAKRAVTASERDRSIAEGEAAAADQRKSGARTAQSGQPDVAPAAKPAMRSSDTLEDLLGLDDDSLYPRLALWLLDASEEEIVAFWDVFAKREDRRRDLMELIFVAWTRLDPLGATAAVDGTEDESVVWRAWACNDPKAALEACLAHKPGLLSRVAWGIGKYRPDWLMANFDRVPEEGRGSALAGLAQGGTGEHPRAMLDFLKEHDSRIPEGLVRALVQRDPWAAVEWFEANDGQMDASYGSVGSHRQLMIETLAEFHPEVLEAVAAREPAGARLRAMEEKLFVRRLENDFEGALAEARATRGPRVAVERLAMAGAKLVRSDPERAFEVVRDLASLDYDPFRNSTWVRYPNGSSGSGNQNPEELEELLRGLLAEDPERLITVGIEARPDERTARNWTYEISGRWAAHNIEEYAGWVTEQEPGTNRDLHSGQVAHYLRGQHRFGEAMEWAQSLGDESRRSNAVRNTVQDWARSDPQGAAHWMEGAELTEAERERYERYFPATGGGGPGENFRPIVR